MKEHPYYIDGPLPQEPVLIKREVTIEIDMADLESEDEGQIHLVTTEPKDEEV